MSNKLWKYIERRKAADRWMQEHFYPRFYPSPAEGQSAAVDNPVVPVAPAAPAFSEDGCDAGGGVDTGDLP